MKVRRAGPDDVEAIASLYLQLKDHHRRLVPGSPRYEMDDDTWTAHARQGLEDPEKRFYVAQRGPEVIAFLKLFFEEKSWGRACEVETLVVDEHARERGVGHELMKTAEEVARQEGALGMRVNVLQLNDEGRRFYERSGYRTIAIRYAKPL